MHRRGGKTEGSTRPGKGRSGVKKDSVYCFNYLSTQSRVHATCKMLRCAESCTGRRAVLCKGGGQQGDQGTAVTKTSRQPIWPPADDCIRNSVCIHHGVIFMDKKEQNHAICRMDGTRSHQVKCNKSDSEKHCMLS